MKPVAQTLFGPTEGNCYTACIASILEWPIEDVPNFAQDLSKVGRLKEGWNETINTWTRQCGFYIVTCRHEEGDAISTGDVDPTLVHIIGGKARSEGALVNHAVVGQGGKMVWDPNQLRGTGLEVVEDYGLFVPLDPAGIFTPGRLHRRGPVGNTP